MLKISLLYLATFSLCALFSFYLLYVNVYKADKGDPGGGEKVGPSNLKPGERGKSYQSIVWMAAKTEQD